MKKFIQRTLVLATLMATLVTGVAQAAVEKPVSFLQYDSEWGSESYSLYSGYSQTIANSGCGPTAVAMVVNYYADASVKPDEMCEYSLDNGYRTSSEGTAWGFFESVAKKYDLDFMQTGSSSEALKWMESKEDPLIVCSMGPGNWTRAGHFILLWDVKDGVAYINDPASEAKSRIESSYNYMASQCKQYFCFDKTREVKVSEKEIAASLEEVENINKTHSYNITVGVQDVLSRIDESKQLASLSSFESMTTCLEEAKVTVKDEAKAKLEKKEKKSDNFKITPAKVIDFLGLV